MEGMEIIFVDCIKPYRKSQAEKCWTNVRFDEENFCYLLQSNEWTNFFSQLLFLVFLKTKYVLLMRVSQESLCFA